MKVTRIFVALYVVSVATSGATDARALTQRCQKHCGVFTSGSVHAAPTQLPATMVGGWCPTRDKPNIYTRSKLAKNNPNCLNIRRDSYGWVEGGCKIKKVKPATVQSYPIYHVYSRCEAEGELHLREHRVFELEGKELYVGVP